jgi:hypothetical protein
VANRKQFRARLAEECGITEEQAKWVCQSVLNSGFASPKNSSFIERIGYDGTVRVQQSPAYIALREDFKTFWKYLKQMPKFKNGSGTAGEILSAFYNWLEMQTMDIIADELRGTDVWFVHDGFMTVERVQTEKLERAVRERMGVQIKLEETDMREEEKEEA